MGDEEAVRSKALAEKAIEAFMKAAQTGRSSVGCAEAALRAHTIEAGLEGGLDGDGEIQVWHLICSLANYSDENGFFRDHVFGPAQTGGPRVHKLVAAVRDLCAERRYDFDKLLGEVNEHIASEGPVAPSI